MLRWICGVTLKDKILAVELRRVPDITIGMLEILRHERLTWFRHVERKVKDDERVLVRTLRLWMAEVEVHQRRLRGSV